MILLAADEKSGSEIDSILKRYISSAKEGYRIVKPEALKNQNAADIRIGICADDDTAALEYFFKTGIPVITCGMSGLDTVTLSGKTENSCCVALQRSLTRIDGMLTEPAEYPVDLRAAYQPFTVMAAVAVMLINGIIPDCL